MSLNEISEKIKRLSEQPENNKPVVVAYGLMNAGKSFLLNMLTQHVQQEFFKTNDIRETAEVKKFEAENCIYLDTPGLDANDSDNLSAEFGVSKADVVLFVHQPQGALEANEVQFLRKLQTSFGEYAASHIIIVITKIDKETPEKILQIEEEIRNQCQNQLKTTFRIFKISNKRYQNGVINHKNGLINQSHIEPLTQHIQSTLVDGRSVRTQRKLVELKSLQKQLTRKASALKQQRMQIITPLQQTLACFNAKIDSLQNFIDDSSQKYQKI